MKNGRTIFLGILAAALLIYIYVDVWRAPSTSELRNQATKVCLFQHDAVRRVELTNAKGTFVITQKNDTDWDIVEPIVFPADKNVLREALIELELARRMDTLPPQRLDAALPQYGLKEPRVKMMLNTKNASQTIAFGKVTPIPGGMYALLSNHRKPEIVVVEQALEEFWDKDLDAWRSHDVFDFHSSSVTGIALRKDQQEIVVKKDSAGNWEISKPLLTRADAEAVNRFLDEILKIRAEKFVSETDAAAAVYGLSTPAWILEIADPQQTRTLKIGSPAPENPEKVFAAVGARAAVFTLPKNGLQPLNDLLNVLRDRRVVSYPYTAAVQELALDDDGAHYKLRRGAKNAWVFTDLNRRADFSQVDSFLGELFAARAGRYPDASSPAAFGFSKPAATIQYSFNPRAPLATLAKTQPAAAPPQTETLTLGNIQNDDVFLQTPRQPSVVTLSKKILELFPKKIWSWFDLKVFDLSDDIIQTVSWKTAAATFSVENIEEREWKSVPEGEPVKMEIFNLQLKTLHQLTAVRWIGLANPNDFAKPLLTITVQHGATTDRLMFAKELGDGTILARLNDDKYAFLISKQDFQTLALSPKITSAP